MLLHTLWTSAAAAFSGGEGSTLYTAVVGTGHQNFQLLDNPYAERNISSVSHVDDTPFDSVRLGFTFPYGGQVHSSVRISPNGALHLDYAPPCGCCFYSSPTRWGGQACNMNTSYFNVIAVSLSDFNPQAHPDSRVVWRRTAAVFEVMWENVTLFSRRCSAGPRFTFGAALYPSGRVRLVLHQVYDPALLDNSHQCWDSYVQNSWGIGLRGRSGVPSPWQTANTWPQIASADGADGATAAWKKDWFTPAPGAYPPRSLVAKGNVAINFCPSARVGTGAPLPLCAQPANAPWEGATSVTLSAAVLSCLDADASLTLQCRFAASGGGAHVAVVATLLNGVAVCAAPAATAVAGGSGSAGAGKTIAVSLWYTSAALSAATWWPLVRGTGAGGADEAAFNYLPSVVRNPEPTCGASQDAPVVCDDCGVCGGGATPCAAALAPPCAASARVPPYNTSNCCGDDALLGEYVCCAAGQLDCFGVCGGRGVVATTAVGSSCCMPSTLRCDGTCSSNALLDWCGECVLGTTGRKPCYLFGQTNVVMIIAIGAMLLSAMVATASCGVWVMWYVQRRRRAQGLPDLVNAITGRRPGLTAAEIDLIETVVYRELDSSTSETDGGDTDSAVPAEGGAAGADPSTPRRRARSSNDEGFLEVSASDGVGGDTCCVCIDTFADGDELLQLPCGHRFHSECIQPWFETSAACPMCKADVRRGGGGRGGGGGEAAAELGADIELAELRPIPRLPAGPPAPPDVPPRPPPRFPRNVVVNPIGAGGGGAVAAGAGGVGGGGRIQLPDGDAPLLG